jgi:hypothetical protein
MIHYSLQSFRYQCIIKYKNIFYKNIIQKMSIKKVGL